MKNISTNILVVALLVVLVIGFYMTLSDLQETKSQISDIAMNSNINTVAGPSSTSSELNVRSINVGPGSDASNLSESSESVSTAILFNTTSSPILTPQTQLTVIVDNIVKTEENRLVVNIKTYTNNAESYSALKPDNLFELVNLGADNQKPIQAQGSFDSIPPQSVVTGQITFQLNEDRNEVILKIQTSEGDEYYRFNFEEQSYEEAILG